MGCRPKKVPEMPTVDRYFHTVRRAIWKILFLETTFGTKTSARRIRHVMPKTKTTKHKQAR